MDKLTVVATGHRPPRLGLDYSAESNRQLTEFATFYLSRMNKFGDKLAMGVGRIVSGMAQGWDQAVAHAAVLLNIPLTCALPFDGHGANWPADARKRHDSILARAERVHVVCPGPYGGDTAKYVLRDKWMVDEVRVNDIGVLLALWDGVKKGGTWATVKYGLDNQVQLANAWSKWQEFKSSSGVSKGVNPTPGAPSDGVAT